MQEMFKVYNSLNNALVSKYFLVVFALSFMGNYLENPTKLL